VTVIDRQDWTLYAQCPNISMLRLAASQSAPINVNEGI
jgi:hypothetical protein